jgi:hypothetical protein
MLGARVLASAVQPWADFYAGSTLVSTTVEFLHLGGLMVAGGFALAFDRAALRGFARAPAQRSAFVAELAAVHPPVLLGLAVVLASGLALLAADLETMLSSPVFWLKMGVLMALLVNGVLIRRAGRQLTLDVRRERSWRALRQGALRSISLWVVLVFLGVLLTRAA